jgi:2-polyprenyl-3-methyl-5-hydroxy-6-metoxy-1,4-benzoquinol methylase
MTAGRASACQVCDSDAHARILMRLGDYAVARCGRCGFVYIDGDRTLVAPSKFDHFEDAGYMKWLGIDNIIDEQVESVQSIIGRAGGALEDIPGDAPVLDVGCARGNYLDRFRHATGRTTLIGVDSATAMVAWGRDHFGLDLRAASIEETDLPPGSFGLITMWDVLEHLAFPRQAAAKMLSLLRPGGWLVLEVPSEVTVFRTLAKLGFRLTGGRWDTVVRELYYPSHRSYFTPASLRALMIHLGGSRVTGVTKEAHITRFGLRRYAPAFRPVIRTVAWMDRALGTQAKILCAVQKPV